ncbi:MAG: UDP-N-acetylmuramoyl-L-alanyl-D-glutamate--2,6-diaminopimelate ligase [Candidatus Promineifilaceae bacterium]|nr:UDP-N-acetylmuramoyl-L-alanyl-D-glutamate--2,6-diaminopimelate ligase [Candidatus Promineifilaceae bacterium]
MAEAISIRTLLQRWREVAAGTELLKPPNYGGPDLSLTHLVEHTDHVEPGACFVARVRATSDGHGYIPLAAEKGASLIVGQRPPGDLDFDLPPGVPYLQVQDTALTMAWLAAAWERFPAQHLVTIGITGTDGKTTTANILYDLLRAGGLRTGLLSTLRAVVDKREEPLGLHVTTPEAPVVQRYLRRMVDAGLTHCILEATSHGLAQQRVGAIDFDVAVVTNITHEHLDYHGSYEAYFAAKATLFEKVARDAWPVETDNGFKQKATKTIILNRDDASYWRLAAIPAPRRLTYGLQETADVMARNVRFDASATHFRLRLPEAEMPIAAHLAGNFNVYNMLAAAAAAHSLGVAPAATRQGLESVRALSGRMERVDEGQPFLTIVDFAHTPNALEQSIVATRRMIPSGGRIITVFGSAGRRDVEKRRLMAEISARKADLTVLTAEDPRTESLEEILEMMAAGCRRQGGVVGKSFWQVPDRGQAIYHALTLARPDDAVLICGKGHEQSMCFGTTEYPWDDVEATRTALQAMRAGRPMPDLGLPTYDAAAPADAE